MSLNKTHLVLFFTRSGSLKIWADKGMIGREVALYLKMLPELKKITFVTYGGEEDLAYEDIIPNIQVLCNRWGLPKRLYALLIPFLHRKSLRNAHLFKTNQIHGADVAAWTARIFQKPLIVRAGYLWPLNFERAKGRNWRTRLMDRVANRVLHRSDQIVLTTPAMKDYVTEHYKIQDQKVEVIPNYVDTELFKRLPDQPKILGRILFIGRITAIKNIDLVIRAIADMPGIELAIIGKGEDQAALDELAKTVGANVKFLGRQPNAELPKFINQAEIFILPSRFEGHPKVLIEAMCCGSTPVIGTDVDGIRTVIEHEKTGLLVDPSVEALIDAIKTLHFDPEKGAEMALAAYTYAHDRFSIDQIASHELTIYQKVLES
ncbi:MAG: glycosyltransferase family 4 protein [Chloroflexota bacterium]